MRTTLRSLSWPRSTDRLALRPAESVDAAAIFAYRTQPEVAMWLSAWPRDVAAFEAEFDEWSQNTLVVEYDGEVVGDLMVATQDGWAQADVAEQAVGTQVELGWVFRPDVHGWGLATEAVRELLSVAFDGIGVRRVEAACFADNVASWKVMEKVGMRRESHNVAESLHRSGQWLDGLQYAILADEWRARMRAPVQK